MIYSNVSFSFTGDEHIKKKLVDQLCRDERVNAAEMHVEVQGGRVTLTGTVPTCLAHDAAQNVAWSMSGVRAVDNLLSLKYPPALSLPANSLPANDQIRSDVQNRLTNSHDIDASRIGVSVRQGVVTLKGTVAAYRTKLRAKVLASSAQGVLNVVNELAVESPDDVTDGDLAARIGAALERHALVHADDVTIKVKNGAVHLFGTVPNWAAWQGACNAAALFPGVLDVRNHLEIDV